ncbi:MFS transporter [Streptomyces iconiensis]|uniref:MFS transporter n=1 Tax=Streptomyces iconiensis TaxID=1384038 RepID=A0ABT7A8W6_9ACTN|nr:MFS transporter [Streptomyces iconiensis]MDJ1137053.1 MFS transporter [Streptomyces iconiensis]
MRDLRGLTGAARFLLVSSFLIPLGSFMVLPFMSVFLHERLGMPLGTVGIVLALASLLQFSGGVLGGALAERAGLRRTMVLALVVRSAGFAAFAAALYRPQLAVFALLLTCCGAALYLPANKAYLVHGIPDERRPAFLSVGNAALNAGMALGPLIAGPFVLSAPGGLFVTVTALFLLLTAGHARLPDRATGTQTGPDETGHDGTGHDGTAPAGEGVPPGGGAPRGTARGGGLRLLEGTQALPFAATALAFYLYFFFQHYLAVFAVERASPEFYSLVLLTCFLQVIVVQPLAARRIARTPYGTALAAGFTALAAGLAVLAVGTRPAMLLGAALITFGDLVLFLKNDLEALAGSRRSDAAVFGQQRLAAGLGACASGVVGGQLFALADAGGGTGGFWLMAAAQCVLLPPLLLLIARRTAPRIRTRTRTRTRQNRKAGTRT